MSSFNRARVFGKNSYNHHQGTPTSKTSSMEHHNHNGNDENGHTPDEFEDDGEGEFVLICSKKHHQRGTKTRMRGRGGGGGGGGHHHHNCRIPLSALPYHPNNIRRTQMLLEQQNNAKNNNADNSSIATTETSSTTNDSSIAKDSLPSSSSGTSTLSTASGPGSDTSSSTTGDVNLNERQPELDAMSSKPKFIEAPIPAVNPWKVFNAAAVLSNKVKPNALTNSHPMTRTTSSVSSNSEPMTNDETATMASAKTTTTNGTCSDNAPNNNNLIPATAPAKTWAAISSSEKTTKPPATGNNNQAQTTQTVVQHTNDSQPVTTSAVSAGSGPDGATTTTTITTTTATASSSAQSSVAPSPGPWVSGRVLKLQQSSPNYTEKLKPTEWPSLAELSNNLSNIELKEKSTKKMTAAIAESKSEEHVNKGAAENKVNSKVAYTVASTQTHTATTSTCTQTQMDLKESHRQAAKSPSCTGADQTEHFDGEYRGRGRGRGRGGSARGNGGGRGGRPSSASGHYKDQSNFAASSSRTDYTDYPPDYTTLMSPFTTVPDFIMPYVAPTTCKVAPIMSPDLAVPQWVIAAPPPRATVVDLVKNQIEYYFSQENLEKDFYLRRKMDADGYLPIRLIASFQRVQSMTIDYSIVTEAIQSSPKLEIRQATASVRTKLDPTAWPIDDGGHPTTTTTTQTTTTKNGGDEDSSDSTTTTKVPDNSDE